MSGTLWASNRLLAAIIVFGPLAGAVRAQSGSLTLRGALAEASRATPAVRLAAAASDAEEARVLVTLRGLLPSVRAEAGVMRTTDPVATFGATLRQRSITTADFDPARLNYPAAISNHQGGVIIEQPLVNVDAWIGRRAAVAAARAARASEEWTRAGTRADVVRAYYGAVLAGERVRTLAAAARAARGHVAQAEAQVRNGLATRSDALLASVRAADVEAQLAEAGGQAAIARRQLGVLLGRSGDEEAIVPATLPSVTAIRALAAADTAATAGESRADVDAADLGFDAARADAARARAARLPRVNSFARYDWYSATRPYTGDKTWTVGLMASWSIFDAASELADARGAAARADLARTASDAVKAKARLEAEQTRITLNVALERLAIAERALGQSTEAHRIVSRKYAGGLATVVELLDAQATETQTALGLVEASSGTIVAVAERRKALGGDPGSVAGLEDAIVPRADSTAR